MKIKRDAIADFLQRWVMPTMAILGWGLLIAFYVMMMGPDGNGENHPPVIDDTRVTQTIVETGQTVGAKVIAADPDRDELHYFWGAVLGHIQIDPHQDDLCTYIAPDLPGWIDVITVTVHDNEYASDKDFVIITVREGGKE